MRGLEGVAGKVLAEVKAEVRGLKERLGEGGWLDRVLGVVFPEDIGGVGEGVTEGVTEGVARVVLGEGEEGVTEGGKGKGNGSGRGKGYGKEGGVGLDEVQRAVEEVVGGRDGAEEWVGKVVDSWREGVKGWGMVRME